METNEKQQSCSVANSTTRKSNASFNLKSYKVQGTLLREDFDGGPVSLDEITNGLFLGNLSAATNMETLKSFKIKHILTLDTVPLPKHILEATFLTTKFIQIADMPKEDILHNLDQCLDFIGKALQLEQHILVHCYFGVSRSSSVVIAFVMKTHDLDYQQAFDLVKSKRRYVQPNSGFIAQLKLYKRMGCKIDTQYQKYKIYRLRLAGEQVRKVKILPQSFNNLIKPDPSVTQENPEPIVYRCRKCRRILASKSHLLAHQSKSNLNVNANIQISSGDAQTPQQQTTRLLDQIASQMRKASIGSPTDEPQNNTGDEQIFSTCKSIIFVEPIAWMKNISHNTQGRLNCPKCEQKLGNFSWINGCQCPCGEEVSPAFYFIPSKVELSKAVQNVQTTV
ncbi:dual specificity protein phosphatase MPK-4 [Teleopsis dalmanni]|uniref:dual specificity protein phosphatase MPK-4 n=1 Tax=Teleopsis dalmanni TaxID=139649 RepID=UPI0018CE30CA|nr:dual specificity protein phosphatase MPK-4 [Teleopsis dalmanni]